MMSGSEEEGAKGDAGDLSRAYHKSLKARVGSLLEGGGELWKS